MKKDNYEVKDNKSKKHGKGKNNNNKRSSTNDRARDQRTNVPDNTKVSGPINDPDYYFDLDKPLAGQLMNFSFSQFQGVDFNLGRSISAAPYKSEVANILRIDINPSPGYIDMRAPLTSGINQQGLRNFIELSANNAKTTQYAPQDVTMLLLALGEVVSTISWVTRSFGLVSLINQRNRAFPKQALYMHGIDAEDFITNLAAYRKRANVLIATANKIPFFDGIPYIKKCSELYSGIYVDAPGVMSQTYMFVPHTTWVFDEAYNEQGSGLRTTQFGTRGVKWDACMMEEVLDTLETMLNSLLSSATLNYIYSDVLRILDSKGGTRLSFTQIPDDYAIVPSYVPECHLWLHNMDIMGRPLLTEQQKPIEGYTFTNSNDVVCDVNSNSVIYRPQFKNFSGIKVDNTLVDFEHDNPDIREKISATRLCTTGKFDLIDGHFYSKEVSLPDHYATSVLTLSGSDTTLSAADLAIDISLMSAAYFSLASHLTKFNYGPLFYVTDEDSSEDALVAILGDLNYYTTIPHDTLAAIHSAAFLKLFAM